MSTPKKTKKKSKGGSGKGAQQFLIWHGEKIAVALIAVVALCFAMQALDYKTLSWRPDELEKTAEEAKTAIGASTRSGEEEVDIKIVKYEEYAQQIKQPIPASPYSTKNWNPIPELASSSASQTSTGSLSTE